MTKAKFALKHRLFLTLALVTTVAAASFSIQSYASADNCSSGKVTFYPNGDDGVVKISGSPSKKQKVCVVSGSVQVPAFTREGYILVGWTKQPDDLLPGDPQTSSEPVTGLTSASSTWSVDGSIENVFAQWQPISYSVKYELAGGNGAPTQTTSTFKSSIYVGATISSSTYSFSTPTKEGFTFAGWSIGGGGSERYSQGEILSAPSSDITFTANWTAK